MPVKKPNISKVTSHTLLLNFDKPEVEWPHNSQFPLNLKDFGRTTEQEIIKDINSSSQYLIVTGFSSLSYLITFFGNKADFNVLKEVRIILGWSPDERVGRRITTRLRVEKDLKERWLGQGYSILENAGAIIAFIHLVEQNIILFRISGRRHLHAKIYVGETHSIFGSPNFSENGLIKQIEASIRVCKNADEAYERFLYENFSLIAGNFYRQGESYQGGILKLLEHLLKITTWQEALARAIHELMNPGWYQDSIELREKINHARLWPIQTSVIGQSLSILQEQGCVLIATPTGSGKTKLISILQLILHHWLIDMGRQHKTFSRTICPPLVMDNWDKEKRALRLSESYPISMGILSFKELDNHKHAKKDINQANVLVVDEAHNFIRTTSQRSMSIAGNKADIIILSTATPISRRPKDLLRMIELLGVDNLEADQLATFKQLSRNRYLSSANFQSLKSFINKFIVRQTKQEINQSIKLNPQSYTDDDGHLFRFPKKKYKPYATGETARDKAIAREINKLSKQLKGIIYLTRLLPPDYELDYPDSIYVKHRIESANRLAKYNVSASLRSSNAALVEHVEGTKAAEEAFGFKTSKALSGKVIEKIAKLIEKNSLPEKGFADSLFPEWLNDLSLYQEACEAEVHLYKKISTLAKQLSGKREQTKAAKLCSLFETENLILAFDSTVITLDYLSSIIKKHYPRIKTYVATGNTDKTPVLKKFARNSREKNILALCSDTLSEGVNLQGASALVFLDIPSVMRIVEQRIGRLDRLDSLHRRISIFFPNDSDEFALKTDIRLLKTMIESDYLIGNNFGVPPEMLDRYQEETVKARTLISMLKEAEQEVEKTDRHWKEFHDAYKPVKELYEGSTEQRPLISREQFKALNDVSVETKVKLSIGYSSKKWLFLALKGTRTSPPKWFFIDTDDTVITNLDLICHNLRLHLCKTEKWEERWIADADTVLKEYLRLLQLSERNSLPTRRKNALYTAEQILIKMKKSKDLSWQVKIAVKEVLELFRPNLKSGEESINYYLFSQMWLDLFNEELQKRRLEKGRRRTVVCLLDFVKEHQPIAKKLTLEKLLEIKDNAPFTEKIWNNVAACIMAIPIR